MPLGKSSIIWKRFFKGEMAKLPTERETEGALYWENSSFHPANGYKCLHSGDTTAGTETVDADSHTHGSLLGLYALSHRHLHKWVT